MMHELMDIVINAAPATAHAMAAWFFATDS